MKIIKWMDDHKLFTILFIVWLAWLVTTVTLIGFINTPDIGTGLATVLVAVWGTPAILVGLVQWRSQKIDEEEMELKKLKSKPKGNINAE